MNKHHSQRAAFSLCLFIFVLLFSCSPNSTEPEPEPDYQLGKNNYTTEVDGATREYFVHVPAGYDAGTSGRGLLIHCISDQPKWREQQSRYQPYYR